MRDRERIFRFFRRYTTTRGTWSACVRCIRVGEVRDPWGYHRPLCVPISILASFHVSRSEALRRSRATFSRISTRDNFMDGATFMENFIVHGCVTNAIGILCREPYRSRLLYSVTFSQMSLHIRSHIFVFKNSKTSHLTNRASLCV